MEKENQAKDLLCQTNRRAGECRRIKGRQGGAEETHFYQSHSLSTHVLLGLSCWWGSKVECPMHAEIGRYPLALHSALRRGMRAKASTLAAAREKRTERHSSVRISSHSSTALTPTQPLSRGKQ